MANSSSSVPGSLIWDPNDCNAFSAQPILPNNTGSTRLCALQTSNQTAMERCCNSEALTYSGCWQYCSTEQPIAEFGDCLGRELGYDDGSRPGGLYCLRNIRSNITRQLAQESWAMPRARAPRLSSILLVASLLACFFVPASATIIPSLDGGLTKRDTDVSSCQFEEDTQWTEGDLSSRATQVFSGFVAVDTPIDGNITGFNRTLNGTSAAEPLYDAFFSVLSQKYGRQFPAMSSVDLWYEFLTPTTTYVIWIPFKWCVNGTASGCGEALGDDNDSQLVEACGPIYVSDGSDPESWTSENMTGAVLQGSFRTVIVA